jgi:hypothetical protein
MKSTTKSYLDSVERITSVSHVRRSDIDTSIDRGGIYVDTQLRIGAVGCTIPNVKEGDIVVVS